MVHGLRLETHTLREAHSALVLTFERRARELEAQRAAATAGRDAAVNEADAARRALAAHLDECAQAHGERDANLAELAAAQAAAAKRIAELEALHAKGSGELAELMRKFMDLTAAKVRVMGEPCSAGRPYRPFLTPPCPPGGTGRHGHAQLGPAGADQARRGDHRRAARAPQGMPHPVPDPAPI